MNDPKFLFSKKDQVLKIENGFSLPKYSILIGKNNSGKSWLLTTLYNKIQQSQNPSDAYYVSPERFGALQRNTNLEDASFANNLCSDKEKLQNQSQDFIIESFPKFNALIAQFNSKIRGTLCIPILL